MRWIMVKVTVAAWIMCASWLAGAGDSLTYVDFIKQLADLERLATLPAPGESCAQWSSYDRASVYDAGSGKYVAWDANGDGGGFIREENGHVVMAEMEGPGCIQRIWSAAPGDGHVRIYLDGAADPAVDLPFMGYFNGKNAPFNRNAICYTAAKGWDCFVPIPYQKSCKIVADKDWGNYFHFTYRTFPKDTQVPTFKRDLTPEENAALDAANKILGACGPDPAGKRADEKTSRNIISLKPGASAPTTLEGPAALTTLRLKIDPPDNKSMRERLRQWTIQIAWDDDAKPAVWAPIADFFGTAPGPNAYRSLPSGLTEDGWWYCHWYMPFARKAVITIANESDVEATFTLETTTAPLTKPPEILGRFHAKWHLDAFLPAEPERAIDWTLLKTEGRGRFCGIMLHVWNPRGGWWGEGDEKFFVDHEKFPSTIGTGSEDYFGYAWGDPELFQRPYHDQTISMNNQGHISVNRWHILDNVPFQRAFEGDIEKYFPNAKPTRYACVAYWYLAPGVTDAYDPVPVAQRTDWP